MSLKTTITDVNEKLSIDLPSIIANLKSEDECKVGQYVWKKYEISPTTNVNVPSFTLSTAATTMAVGVRYSITGISDYILNNIDEVFFDGAYYAKVGQRGFEYNNGRLEFYGNSNNLQFVSTYDKTAHQLVVTQTNGTLWNGLPLVFDKARPINVEGAGEFINYIVNDSPTAYTDGKQDGYWYEKLNGESIIDFGEVVLSSDVQNITIEHGLNKIPEQALIIAKEVSVSGSNSIYTSFALSSKSFSSNYPFYEIHGYGSSNLTRQTSQCVEMTEETITFKALGSGNSFRIGTYRWFALA